MEWNKISDKVPMEMEQVLTYGEDFGYAFGIWTEGRFYEGACSTEHEYNMKVEYWAELTKPID